MKKQGKAMPTVGLVLCMLLIGYGCNKTETNDLVENPDHSALSSGLLLMDRDAYGRLPGASTEGLVPILDESEVALRSSVLRLPTPPVKNQGSEGSCTAFSIGYVVTSYMFRYKNKQQAFTDCQANRSPEFLYNFTKLPGQCSTAGAYCQQVLNYVKNTGLPRWCEMPYTDKNGCSGGASSQVFLEANSKGKVIKNWGTIKNQTATIRQWISYGYPVIIGMPIDGNFIQQTQKPPYIYKAKGGAHMGGHAMVITGYDDNRQAWVIQNSWGTGWADKGFCYIDYKLLGSIPVELYVTMPS